MTNRLRSYTSFAEMSVLRNLLAALMVLGAVFVLDEFGNTWRIFDDLLQWLYLSVLHVEFTLLLGRGFVCFVGVGIARLLFPASRMVLVLVAVACFTPGDFARVLDAVKPIDWFPFDRYLSSPRSGDAAFFGSLFVVTAVGSIGGFWAGAGLRRLLLWRPAAMRRSQSPSSP